MGKEWPGTDFNGSLWLVLTRRILMIDLKLIFSALLSSLGVIGAVAAVQTQPKSPNPVVVIQTSMGDITVELFKNEAPKSTENFLAYVKSGFYGGTIFHRVIKGSMIQGGRFTPDMTRKPTRPPIPNESGNGLTHARGTVAMARTADPNSATAQFFINTVNNAKLDPLGYAVFGKVTAGMSVVEQIESATTGMKGSYRDVPVQPILIKAVRVKVVP